IQVQLSQDDLRLVSDVAGDSGETSFVFSVRHGGVTSLLCLCGLLSTTTHATSAPRTARAAASINTHRKPTMNESAIARLTLTAVSGSIVAGGFIAANFARSLSNRCRASGDSSELSSRRSSALLNVWSMATPKTAIASNAATRATALLAPEATPARSAPTEVITTVVRGAALDAIPRPSKTMPGKKVVQ